MRRLFYNLSLLAGLALVPQLYPMNFFSWGNKLGCLTTIRGLPRTEGTFRADHATNHFSFLGDTYSLPEAALPAARIIELGTGTNYQKARLLSALEQMFQKYNPDNEVRLQRGEIQLLNQALQSMTPRPPQLDQAKEVIISTHQTGEWQEAVASNIKQDPRLQTLPLVVLQSGRFPLVSSRFAKSADLIVYSRDGELPNVPAVADKFHLMGGNCNNCMLKTIADVITQRASSSKDTQPLEIFIHAGATYMAGRSIPELIRQNSALKVGDLIPIEELKHKGETPLFQDMKIDDQRKVETLYGQGLRITLKNKNVRHRPIQITFLPN